MKGLSKKVKMILEDLVINVLEVVKSKFQREQKTKLVFQK